MYQMKEDRSIGDLFSELADETRTLLRQEVALAKAEIKRDATKMGKDAALMAAGGVLGFVAFQVLVATIIIALDLILPLWLSALLVTLLLGIVAYVLLQRGRADMKKRSIVPKATIQTLKEDKEWAQRQMS